MKLFRLFLITFSFVIVSQLIFPLEGYSQCAMCSLNAENSTQNGNTQGKGLNNGIFFLLAMPFLIGIGGGVLWYTKFRKKEENTTIL